MKRRRGDGRDLGDPIDSRKGAGRPMSSLELPVALERLLNGRSVEWERLEFKAN